MRAKWDGDRSQKRDTEDFHHLPRDDSLLRQPRERQIDVRAEQGGEQHQRRDAGIEAERGIGATEQRDLDEKQKAKQNREEEGRDAGAEGKVVHVGHGAGIRGLSRARRPANAYTWESAAMIFSACGLRVSALWNGPPGGRIATPVQHGRR